MWVQGDRMSDLMVDGSKTEELAVTSERDPSKVDHVHIRELGVLEAMRRVGGLVPKSTTTAKHLAMEMPVTGMMLKDREEHIFTALPPYTATQAFISMWGYCHSDFMGTPRECRGYVAISPICVLHEMARVRRPLRMLSLVWGPPGMQGLRGNCACFWTSKKAGVRQPLLNSVPDFGDPRECKGYVAILPTCGLPRRQE